MQYIHPKTLYNTVRGTSTRKAHNNIMHCIRNLILNHCFTTLPEPVSDNPMLFYSASVSIFLYLVLLLDKNLHSETERGGVGGGIIKALYSSPEHESFQGSNIQTE